MKNVIFILLTISITLSFTYGKDQGITSEVHRNNIGKIVFAKSKSDLSFKNEKPSKFKNSFSTSDNIYGRLYVSKSLSNLTGEYPPGVLMYDMYIDNKRVGHKKSFGMYRHLTDKPYYTEYIDGGDQFNIWTSWKVWLLPVLDDEELKFGNCNIAARAFTLSLLDLNSGVHNVRIEVYYSDMVGEKKTDVIAVGEIKLDVKAEDMKNLAFAYAPPLPKDEYTGKNKSAVIKQIETAFEKQIGKKPLLCGIYKSGWNEGSYKLTGQKYKKIAGWAVFEDTDGDGQVPITTFNFISDYTNGGWTKLRFDSHCLGCADWDVETAAVKALTK